MWNRQELKSRGKIRFKANYWKCVVAALLLSMSLGGSFGNIGRNMNSTSDTSPMLSFDVFVILAGIIGFALFIGLVIKFLVTNPLEVGCQRFFITNTKEDAQYSELSFAFKNSYGNVILTLLLRDVFLALWFCLFVIPGIVKAYSYRMVPYILAESPDMPWKDAIDRSREMMEGNKWKTFVLDVSFIGWILLSVCTCGILQIFYVGPYIAATGAELYEAIKTSYRS